MVEESCCLCVAILALSLQGLYCVLTDCICKIASIKHFDHAGLVTISLFDLHFSSIYPKVNKPKSPLA
jgi:hypothetical protein